MIEIRADGTIPGRAKYGRIYQVVDLNTGELGYNYTSSDLPGLNEREVNMIEGYDSFQKWVTDIKPISEIKDLVQKLNRNPDMFIETPHTQLVKRVRQRLAEKNDQVIDGHTIMDDMIEMHRDLSGGNQKPAFPGW